MDASIEDIMGDNSALGSVREGAYIFDASEFRNDSFHAATFVSKFRHTTSLENLRDQLRDYCKGLKAELYGIINKDYKDFITIATKLDGVDIRVEHLRKPLVDIRMDLTMLHDTMVSNLQTIQDKLKHKEEIRSRRRNIENALASMSHLDVVEVILSQEVSASEQEAILTPTQQSIHKRHTHRRLRAAAASPDELEIFSCSELERAAASLSAASQHTTSAAEYSTGGTSASSIAIHRSLEVRLKALKDSLLGLLRDRLPPLVTRLVTAPPDDITLQQTLQRCTGHLLRAFVALEATSSAEEILAETFAMPIARSVFTQSRVDGTGGKGSCAGLDGAFKAYMDDMKKSFLLVLLLSENMFSCRDGQPVIDLVLRCVWSTIANVLSQSFSAMFTHSTASVVHSTYTATCDALLQLQDICGQAHSDNIGLRIRRSSEVRSFLSKWNLDAYLQLRTKEIVTRVDKLCELSGKHGLAARLWDNVYAAPTPQVTVKPGDKNTKIGVIKDTSSSSRNLMSADAAIILSTATERFKTSNPLLDITKILIVECLYCAHDDVFLPPLCGQLLALMLKVLNRFEYHVKEFLGVHTSNLPSSIVVPCTNYDDLTHLLKDVSTLQTWMTIALVSMFEAKVYGASSSLIDSPVRKCLASQAAKIDSIKDAVWARIASLISTDCIGALSALKTIAGKYRMTNKPPPDTHSSFVPDILKPLREFERQYLKSSSLPLPASLQNWKLDIISIVLREYSQQAIALMNTAKQMDTTLLRRKGKSGASSGSSAMTDSEKIALQFELDSAQLGTEVEAMCGVSRSSLSCYVKLHNEIAEFQRSVEST